MAYNEAKNLESVVSEIHRELEALKHPYEILIVNDGSNDGTAEIAERIATQGGFTRLIHHSYNSGLGAVYRSGLSEANRDYISFFPADGQFPANIISQFIPFMRDHDLVLGYLETRRDSNIKRLISYMEKALYRMLFGGFPKFQGIFMVRREILDTLPLHSKGRGWGIVMELILRARNKGLRVISLPIAVRPRLSGESKVHNFRTIWSNIKQVLKLRYSLWLK